MITGVLSPPDPANVSYRRKEERAFNRALARVRALSQTLEDEARRLDGLLVFHAAEVRPRQARAVELRSGLVRALAPFLEHRRLGKTQRVVLQQILVEQLDVVLAHTPTPDDDLQALVEQLHQTSFAQAQRDQIDEARADMSAMFDELGLDIDVPDLRPDMTPEEIAAATARFAEDLGRAQEPDDADGSTRARSKREQRAEERARRHAQVQKDSLGAIYRRLVKELHPDLESDAAARQHKGAIMQQVTAAYARRDLHALLHLELEWLGAAAGAWRTVQDKLTAYTELLKEQAAQLQAELRELRLHPKYAPLLVGDAFGRPMVVNGPAEVERLDAQTAQLGTAIERLSTDQALAEVRGAIREYQATRKRWTMPRLRRQ